MILDILLVILIITALVKGYSNGFVVAVFSAFALIVGLAAAIKLSALTAEYLKDSINVSSKWLPILSFILVFLAVVLLVRVGAKAIEKTLQLVMLGFVNRLAGIALYLILYIIIFSVVLFYADKAHIITPELISKSSTYQFIKPWGPRSVEILAMALPFFKNMFHQLEIFFEGVAAKKA